MNKRVVIVQCRLSSSRLPQKALKNLGEKTVLDFVLQAMKKVPADRYFVATDFDSYEKILPFCKKNDFECFAGSLNDVLKRFVDLLNSIDCETVIRATADNPFLFYEAATESAELFEKENCNFSDGTEGKCDYLTFTGLPHGSGVEIFSASALKDAILHTEDAYDHEHVGPSLYNHKDRYCCKFIPSSKYSFSNLRTTIDTYSDYLRAVAAVNFLGETSAPYSFDQIVGAFESDFVKNPVFLVPSVKKGFGTGHLRRMLSVALEKKYFVYIPDSLKDSSDSVGILDELSDVLNEFFQKGLSKNQIVGKLPDETFAPVIVTDNFKISQNDMQDFSSAKKIISIDDGSTFKNFCDYTVNVIPPLKDDENVNLFAPELIEKPRNIKEKCFEINLKDENKKDFCSALSTLLSRKKILVCFGGEDPSGLTIPVTKILAKLFAESSITVVCAKRIGQSDLQFIKNAGNILIQQNIPNLKEKIFEYDVVITHYGLTAFEGIAAGCFVLLFSTTKLHENLARKYGFPFVKYGKICEKSVLEAFSLGNSSEKNPSFQFSSCQKNHEEKLSNLVEKVSFGTKMLCPVCQKNPETPDEIVSRNKNRTYRRCRTCSMVYISYSIEQKVVYEKSYFFEDYKKQYGKTYQEDFNSIKNQGIRRICNIKKIAENHLLENKTLLDIGCAFGPFLQAAFESGIKPFGTDISQEAVSFVREKLHFPSSLAQFPILDVKKEFGVSNFDIVTMWYVIEHFENLDSVLKKVSQITKKGGIFAFSTPCGEGVSAKSNKQHFYEISPSDHFTVWEKSSAKKILAKYGFKVVKIVSTGHHPERFPSIKKSGAKSGSFQWKFIEKISKMKKLGDTMEVYCQKISE